MLKRAVGNFSHRWWKRQTRAVFYIFPIQIFTIKQVKMVQNDEALSLAKPREVKEHKVEKIEDILQKQGKDLG